MNWKSIIYRKRAIQKSGIEKMFLAAKGFNTNLVQFLNVYDRIILLLVRCTSALLHAWFPSCMDAKTILHARNLAHEKL